MEGQRWPVVVSGVTDKLSELLMELSQCCCVVAARQERCPRHRLSLARQHRHRSAAVHWHGADSECGEGDDDGDGGACGVRWQCVVKWCAVGRTGCGSVVSGGVVVRVYNERILCFMFDVQGGMRIESVMRLAGKL